ncbi:MAG: hypothetical protein ACXWQ5_00725 [Ktedonobacterales bacterium]
MTSPNPAPNPDPRPRYISAHQSADILGIDMHLLIRLIIEGYLSTIDQSDGNIAVDLDDVLWMRPVVAVARDCYEAGISVEPDDIEDVRFQHQVLGVDSLWHQDR